MITVTIGNSMSQIVGLPRDKHRELKKLMSYRISEQAHYFSGGFGSRERSLLDKKGCFPTGLLYILKKYLKQQSIKTTIYDKRKRPKSFIGRFKLSMPVTPYQDQENVSNSVLKRNRGNNK